MSIDSYLDSDRFKLIQQIKNCKLCGLCSSRQNAVVGVGNWNADIMIIGEAPGKDEDIKGLPFVGRSGKILDFLLDTIALKRTDIFITNVVKCRPPKNRDPYLDEVNKCRNYLERQINIIKPKLIITLGRHSMNRFHKGLKISEVHGELIYSSGIWQAKQAYLPLYHPAASLYDPRKKEVLLSDFKKIPNILNKINDSS